MTDTQKKENQSAKIKELQILTDNLFERFDDLEERFDTLEASVKREITGIKGEITDLKTGQDKMMGTLDSIAGMLQDRQDEEAAGTVWIKEHDKQLENHENRIQKLEMVSA